MRIITIGWEFGSGGREPGKRLADTLGVPCYDQEIIEEVACLHGMDPAQIEHISKKDFRAVYPITIGRRFVAPPPVTRQTVKIPVSQQEVVKTLARQGDCVIVGRCADLILKELDTLNLFVYADQSSKLHRCIERAPEGEKQQDILRRMQRIDRDRASFRELLSDTGWGRREAYHLCINTSGCEIKALIPAIAEFANCWFAAHGK